MAYDYLGLTNKILNKVNEVELDTTTFSTADGFYLDAKNSINYAIRDLNQEQFEWPFNFTEGSQLLTAGVSRYTSPATAKRLDFNSFRVQRDNTLGNLTQFLRPMTYEDYLKNHIDQEYNTSDTSIRDVPRFIVRLPNNNFAVTPAPNQAYTLDFDYYSLPTDLIAHDDVPSAPEAYESVILDGAMYHAYMFRGDKEAAQLSQQKFLDGVNDMRAIYTNRYEYMQDTRVRYATHTSDTSNYIRVS